MTSFVNLLQMLSLTVILCATAGRAQQPPAGQTKFSHKGIKAALGLGNSRIMSEPNFEDGKTVDLNLGYGFNEQSTLWLTVIGAEFEEKSRPGFVNELDAVEISYQHKFASQTALQPYGKIGFGGYVLKERESNNEITGGGASFALGMDFFPTRHFGIGAELFFKDIEYHKRHEDRADGELVTDLEPPLNRDARGFVFTITVQ